MFGARRAVHVARVAVLVRHRRVRLLVPRRLHVLVRRVTRDYSRLYHGGDKEESDGRGVEEEGDDDGEEGERRRGEEDHDRGRGEDHCWRGGEEKDEVSVRGQVGDSPSVREMA